MATWEAALAADKAAVREAEAAVRNARAAARVKARTGQPGAALQVARSPQVPDTAQLQDALTAAQAKVRSDALAFARTIRADKLRLGADFRQVRRGARRR